MYTVPYASHVFYKENWKRDKEETVTVDTIVRANKSNKKGKKSNARIMKKIVSAQIEVGRIYISNSVYVISYTYDLYIQI